MKHHTTWRSRCCFFHLQMRRKEENNRNQLDKCSFENTVTKTGTCVYVCFYTCSFFAVGYSVQFCKTLKKLQIFQAFDAELRDELHNATGKSSDFMGDTSMKTVTLNSVNHLGIKTRHTKMSEHIQRKKEEGEKAAEKQCIHDACPVKCSGATARTFSKWKVRAAGEEKKKNSYLWPADFNPFTVSVLAVWIFCQTQWQFSCGLWYHLKFLPDFQKDADFYFSDLSLSPRNLAVSWQRPGQIHFLSLAQAGFKLGKQKSCFWPTYCAPQHHSGPMTPLFSIISLVVILFGVAYFLWKVGGGGGGGIIQICPKKIVTPILNFLLLLLPFWGWGVGGTLLSYFFFFGGGGWRGAYYHHLASHRVTGSWQPTPPSPPPQKKKHVKIETGGIHPCCITTAYQKSMSASRKQIFFPAYEKYTNNCEKNNTHTHTNNK